MRETDPYGSLEFAVGSEDDFFCFDYAVEGRNVCLHAVINSETGSFIMNASEPVTVDANEAVAVAEGMVSEALDWCADSGGDPVEHDCEGWNQDPHYFVRCVQRAVDMVNTGKAEKVERVVGVHVHTWRSPEPHEPQDTQVCVFCRATREEEGE